MKVIFCFLVVFIFSVFFPNYSFCDTTESDTDAEPYTESEFPQWALDLRRFEIVSLGSVPFVMINVTLGYSAYQYFSGKSSSFTTPFAKGNSYSEGEIFGLLFTSIGIGAAIGIIDFTINIIRRHNEKKLLEKIESQEQIIVKPYQKLEETESE